MYEKKKLNKKCFILKVKCSQKKIMVDPGNENTRARERGREKKTEQKMIIVMEWFIKP